MKVLYIGNKLAGSGATPTGVDLLGERLRRSHVVVSASSVLNPIFRLADMLLHVWRHRTSDYVIVDCYSTNAFYFAWLVSEFCAVLDLRYVPILHGGNFPDRIKRSPWKCRRLLSRSYRNVAPSAYLADLVRGAGYEVSVVPNAIELDHYPFSERSSVGPRLLYVRALASVYRPELLVDLVADLREAGHEDANVSFVGPDKDGSLGRVRERIEARNVHAAVQIHGLLTREEWVAESTKHDVFVNPTSADNLPVSLIEAMALGLPVISTGVGGIPKLVEHEVNGLLVEVDSVGALKDAVQRLIREPAMAEQLSRGGRRTAETYAWSRIRHLWDEVLA